MVSDLLSGVLWPEPCRRWVSELKRRSCESEGSGVILDEGMVSDLVSGVLWPEPCRRWVNWREEAVNLKDLEWFWMKEWSLISCQVFSDLNPVEDEWVNWREEAVNLKDLEWFWMKEWSLISCQVFSDLNPVEDEWGELKRRSCESEGLEWFWMKEWSLISCQVFSDLNPVEDEWGELERRSCESEGLEWFWMKEWSLISCQVFSDLNPVEHEWGELKRRSCESEGSGVILDEGMVSDLVSGVLWPEPCRTWVRWTEEAVNLKIWSDSGWRNGLWSRVRCLSDLNPVEDEWVNWREEAVNLKDLECFWMKERSLISCQVFSDLNPVEDEWTEEEKLWIWRSGVILDEGMVSDLVSGVLWPEPCRTWVRWTEEAVNLKIWSDSGWRNGLWSLVRCSLTWTL